MISDKQNDIRFMKYIFFPFFFYFIVLKLYGQEKNLHGEFRKVDSLFEIRNYDKADSIISIIKPSSQVEKYALDLRVAKFKFYVDEDESEIIKLFKNLEFISSDELQYQYFDFLAYVFKRSKNFKKSIKYYRKALFHAERRKDTMAILFGCLNLGQCFYRIEYLNIPKFNNNIDSTFFYYQKALKFPENSRNNKIFTRIYDNLSKIEIQRKNIKKAEEYNGKALSINKQIDNRFGIAISYLNKSKILFLKKKYRESIEAAQKSNHFIKDKSLSIKRDNLKMISDNYKFLNNFENGFIYLERATQLDKVINRKSIEQKISRIEAKYFNTKKQKEILEEKNKRLITQLFLYSSIFIIVILVISGFTYYLKAKHYKYLFKNLLKNNSDIVKRKITSAEKKLHGIPNIEIEKTLKKLDSFEKRNLFLKQNLSLNLLAKELGSNSTYLSKIINTYKDKNFNRYISDLRIEYIIAQLKTDKKLQHYTIKAIAQEGGFSNSQSFSLAFREKTGLYPSYFIKQLKQTYK